MSRSSRRKPSKRIGLVGTALVFIVLLYGIEGLCYLIRPQVDLFFDTDRAADRTADFDRMVKARLDKQGKPFDPASLEEAYARFRSQGIELQPYLSQAQVKALAGKEYREIGVLTHGHIITEKRNGYWSVNDTDEFGFHNPPGQWSRPISHFFLGRSVFFGVSVNSGEDVVSRIREQVPGALNLSTMTIGLPPEIYLRVLNEYALGLKPKWVVWPIFEYDRSEPPPASRLAEVKALLDAPMSPSIAPRAADSDAIYAEAGNILKAKLPPARERLSERGPVFEVLTFRNLHHDLGKAYRYVWRKLFGLSEIEKFVLRIQPTTCDPEFVRFEMDIYRAIKAKLAANGIATMAMYMPANPIVKDEENAYCRKTLIEEYGKIDGVFINMSAFLFEHPEIDPETYFMVNDFNHLTPYGHSILAAEILRQMPR